MNGDALSDALMSALTSHVIPDFLRPDVASNGDEHKPPPAMHETLLIVPAAVARTAPLDVHIDNCHRRCIAFYDSQRIVQFGG